jgi:hypothetical protein
VLAPVSRLAISPVLFNRNVPALPLTFNAALGGPMRPSRFVAYEGGALDNVVDREGVLLLSWEKVLGAGVFTTWFSILCSFCERNCWNACIENNECDSLLEVALSSDL